MSKKTKGNWRVEVECIVRKVLTIHGCTKEQAQADPWDYCVEESEQMQVDWEVLNVKSDL